MKRYDIGREFAANISTPGITEQPDGGYVRYDDHVAVAQEIQAEIAGLERAVADQAVVITELREAAQSVSPDIEGMIERLLDAQQDINVAANQHMSQSLCDASALIDEVEQVLRRTFEGAFLGQILLPSGQTILEHATANKLLPAPTDTPP